MRSERAATLAAAFLALAASCATTDSELVTVSANYQRYDPQVFVVLPFVAQPPQNPLAAEEIEDYEEDFGEFSAVGDDGPTVVRELFEEAFVGSGADVVVRDRLSSVLEELEFQSASGLTADDASQVGQILNADAIIEGTVMQYNYYYVEFSIRAIDVERGVVLFSASATARVWEYDDDPSEAARWLSRDIVDALRSQINQ